MLERSFRRLLSARLAAIVAVLVTVAPAAASAAVRTGQGTDPAQDHATGARDITVLRVTYDTAGSLEAAVTLRDVPTTTDNAFVSVVIGTPRTDGSCADPFVLAAAFSDPADATAAWVDSDTPGNVIATGATKQTVAAVITLRVANATLPSTGFACATAKLTKVGDTTVTYDALDAPIVLAEPAPTPTATPAPTPTPTAAPPVTPEQVAPPVAAQTSQPKIVGLTAAAPNALPRGAWAAVPVRIVNGTTKRLPATQLAVRTSPGLTAGTATRRIKPLAPGAACTTTVRVRTSKRAGATATLRLRLLAGTRTLARTTAKLVVGGGNTKPAPKPAPGAGATPADPDDLSGRHYSRWVQDPIAGALVTGYAFVSSRFVFKGVPEGGLPTCAAASDTCLPYTYSAATNALTISGQPATFSADRALLTVDGTTFPWNPIPPAGSRFQLALTHTWAQGLWPYATSGRVYLAMSSDGRFTLGSTSIASLGAGTNVETFTSSVGADQRGTYEVQAGARLQLRFDDGTVQVRTIAITRDGTTGSADPAKDGLILDRDYFWVPAS